MKCRGEIEQELLNGRTPQEYIQEVGGSWADFVEKVNAELDKEKVKEVSEVIKKMQNNELESDDAFEQMRQIILSNN